MCNIVYHAITRNFQATEDEHGDKIDRQEQVERFEVDIGQRVNPEHVAVQKVREMLIAMGKDPDAQPELTPEQVADMNKNRVKTDDDVMWGEGNDFEIKGRRLKTEDSAL